MKLCASVVSRAALVLLAVVTASVGSSEDTSEGNPWIPVDRPNSKKLSNVDDNAVSGITVEYVLKKSCFRRSGGRRNPPRKLKQNIFFVEKIEFFF